MRRVAGSLETGPPRRSGSAHVVNKEDLDDLLIGRLCAENRAPPTETRPHLARADHQHLHPAA